MFREHAVAHHVKPSLYIAISLVVSAFSALCAQSPGEPSTPGEQSKFDREILTPAASPIPRINGASVFGARPGSAFLYSVPATGQRPMTFAAEGLPPGIVLDAATGRITGAVSATGEYPVLLKATNALGSASRKWRIIIGDKIALTPPMGWNSWNCWGGAVSQEKVLSSAQAMVTKGLQDHGWAYINIDDGWQGMRGGEWNGIQPNAKFPDLKALGDAVHSLGLKLGIYSTPWRGTYEGHVGSSCDHEDGSYDWIKAGDHNEFYRVGIDPKTQNERKRINFQFGKISFVEKDVAQWAAWGVDYLKYDWSPNDVPHAEAMAAALRMCGRDVVFSLSNSTPFTLAQKWVDIANAWRTTGDIRDDWESMSRIGFSQDRWAGFAGPGHWNDPDMLVVGQVGWGPKLHPTRLTSDEQYTHLSLWCLLGAPLLIGCDIAQMDDFTVGLLTNDEVLDIDQDALGQQAVQIAAEGDKCVYAKKLEDGTTAVGLFNRGGAATSMSVGWGAGTALPGVGGDRLSVRDVWRQKDIGLFDRKYACSVAAHGVMLIRLSAPK